MFRDPSTLEGSDLPPAPFGPAVSILRTLLQTSQLALYQVQAGRIDCLYCSPDFPSQAERVWAAQRRELLSGNTVRVDGFVYRPIIDGRVVGVLASADVGPDTSDTFQTSLLLFTLRFLPEVMKCASGAATTETVPTDPQNAPSVMGGNARSSDSAPLGDAREAMRLALNEIEQVKLRACLERHGWVVSEVAREMHVNRATVYRKMENLGIVRASPSPKAPLRRTKPRLSPRFS